MLYLKVTQKTVAVVIFFVLFPRIFSQVVIDAPDDICLGNLGNFKLKNTSGKTITSWQWKFGDGSGSALGAPSYLYRDTGSFTITCDVEFTDKSTSSASHNIRILSLPKAIFTTSVNPNGLCQHWAHICYADQSKKAETSRDIHKVIITWGDGNLDVYKDGNLSPPYCHDYDVVGDFKIRFEVVDVKGCKDAMYEKVNVIEGAKAKIDSSINYSCTSSEFCVNGTVTPFNASYEWYVNGINIPGNPQNFCNTYFKDTTLNILLVAKNLKTKCPDSAWEKVTIQVASNSLRLKLRSHNFCHKDSNFWAQIESNIAPTKIEWYLDGILQSNKGKNLVFNAKDLGMQPGHYTLKCVAWFGTCKLEQTDTFRIRGPVINVGVWNAGQCNSNNKVYFEDSTRYSSGHLAWYWDNSDYVSDTCTIWRAFDQNRYSNCIHTRDWWGKHQYPYNFDGIMTLTVHDSVTQCFDDTGVGVLIGDCIPVWIRDEIKLCQGDTFLNVPPNYFNPRYFSMDTGKTWLPFPSKIDTPYYGWYGLSFIIPHNFPNHAQDYGNDSFEIVSDVVTYDTLFYPHLLFVDETPALDSISVVTTGCKTCRIKLNFGKHKFKPDQNIYVDWKGTTYRYFIDRDTILDTLIILPKAKGGDTLIVTYTNASGCTNKYKMFTGCGMDMEIVQDKTACKGGEHCIALMARDNVSDTFYNMYNAGLIYKVQWGKNIYPLIDHICATVDSGGIIPLTFFAQDRRGCLDSLKDSILVQHVQAGVTPDSRLALCSELKQLFDSSYVSGYNAKIEEYGWNFNRKDLNSELKDPVQLFEKGGKNHIKHWVKSSFGCTDTMEYDIEISGSQPYFTTGDTLGCAAFEAHFKNLSKNCRTYIWEFGDPQQNTESKSDTSETKFTYTVPGIYYVRLTGIDTIFDPVTGEAYHCHSEFPNNPDTIRKVHVLPYFHSKIFGPDSICPNTRFYINSMTDASAQNEIWTYPDGKTEQKPASSSEMFTMGPGIYTFKVKPDYGQNPGEPYCADTPSHTVYVIGVKADFDFTAPRNDGYYEFTNKSSVEAIKYSWDFGHPASGNNTSTLKDPTHDYYPDTGNFKVCLIVTNSLGCKDTLCKNIPQYYMEYLMLANVFTPGDTDGKNDLYDVVIEGEKEYDLKIFNRWGEVVYHSKTDGNRYTDKINWNGKVHNTGATCPEGDYFYQFTYSFKRHPEKLRTISGSITLIR